MGKKRKEGKKRRGKKEKRELSQTTPNAVTGDA
jgi:hypothetical protein